MTRIKVYGLLVASGSDLWISTQAAVSEVLTLPGHGRDTLLPINGGFAGGDIEEKAQELERYLNFGMPIKAEFEISDASGALQIEQMRGVVVLTNGSSRHQIGPDERAKIAAIEKASALLGSYNAQKLSAGFAVNISDWQGPDRANKTTDDTLRLKIRTQAQRVMITAPDGREVDIELQDNIMRVFAYDADGASDEPVKIDMHKDCGIEVDTSDYEQDRYLISDMEP
jgi:hypothetical protein